MKYITRAWMENEKIIISQELQALMSDRTREISRQIINLQDNAIREALISLGWTPPKKDTADGN